MALSWRASTIDVFDVDPNGNVINYGSVAYNWPGNPSETAWSNNVASAARAQFESGVSDISGFEGVTFSL